MDVTVTRLYTGPDAESHFEDIKLPLKDYEGIFEHSETIPAKGLIFQKSSGAGEHGWHNAPRRQYVITLIGQIEIELIDGTKRIFGPGDLLLAEDTTGRGHKTRHLECPDHRGITITLE